MNRLANWMIRLYPARWRRRYGDELDALLAETGADVRVVTDLLKGGVRMQFSTWSFAKLAVVLGVGGLLLGAAGSFLVAPVYVSRATLRMDPLAEILPQVEPRVLSRASLSGIANGWPADLLYKDELKVTPLIDVLDRMRGDIRVAPIAASGADDHAANLAISFRYRDPAKAQHAVAALIERFRQEAAELGNRPLQPGGKYSLEVIDEPDRPVRAVNGMRLQWGLVLTLSAMGLWIAFARRRARKTGFVARHFRTAAVLFTLTGFMAGLAVVAADVEMSWRNGPQGEEPRNLFGEQYRSSALVRIPDTTPEQMTALQREVLSRTSLSGVIQDPRTGIYRDQLKNEPLEDVVQTMRQHLTVEPSDVNRQDLRISFQYNERQKTERAVWFIVNQFDDAARRMHGGTAAVPAMRLNGEKLTVVEQPSLPVLPVSPDRYRMAGTGGIAGLLAAAIIATIRRRWKPEADIPLDPVSE